MGEEIELQNPNVEADINANIDLLTKALKSVKIAFETHLNKSIKTSNVFMILAITLSVLILVYYILITINVLKPDFKTSKIEIAYDIGVRITIISLVISLITFCLKMMRVYFALCERIRHKIAVIESMPSLLEASGADDLFKTNYNKLVEMLIQINADSDFGKDDGIKIEAFQDVLKVFLKKE